MDSLLMEKTKAKLVDYASKHYIAMCDGNGKMANYIHKKLTSVYNKVRDAGKQEIFIDLLNHQNEGIRHFAAVCLLKTNPKLAIDCLNKLVELPGIISSQAKMTLYLWDRDELDLL